MNYLGEYLKKRLIEMKTSEREISAKCGISHSYLNQLIKGINPSTKKSISPTLSTLEKLAEGFGVSADFLQKITRGLVSDEELFIEEKKLGIDKLLQVDNNGLSPDLLKQIQNFQKIMLCINFEKFTRSESEMSKFISELEGVIKKHFNTQQV